jgi:SynChlorMet cassette protein ScmD
VAGRHAIANPSVVLREESDGWSVLFDADTGRAMGVNRVGVAIWKRLDGSSSPEEIARELESVFAEVPGSVAEETSRFVERLAAEGFVGYEIGERSAS